MSFDDIASRFKKHQQSLQQDAAAAALEEAAKEGEREALRGRIVGVLLRDARVARGYTVEHLAELLDLPSSRLIDWEFGRDMPSLPELELLSYVLEIPVSHLLMGTETLLNKMQQRDVDQAEYIKTRTRMIGATIRVRREAQGLKLAHLAENVGLPPETLQAYEYGQQEVPLTHLTRIADALHVTLSYFLEERNRVGSFIQAQEAFDHFLEMDAETRQFIANPSNLPYIELAIRLKEFDAKKLRDIAEHILEISL